MLDEKLLLWRIKRGDAEALRLVNAAVREAGCPVARLHACAEPTIETAQALMKHPAVTLLVVTGGPGVVKAAMKSGKRAVCAGPGNPPVVVDATADIAKAGRDIVYGASLALMAAILFIALVALLAGLAIFPALFAFGLEPTAGPGLVFVVVPTIFANMGGIGVVFSALFFIALAVAAFLDRRLPFPGIAPLYRGLHGGRSGQDANPMISSALIAMKAVTGWWLKATLVSSAHPTVKCSSIKLRSFVCSQG